MKYAFTLQGYREFRNFELGVLFRSTKTRQYFALNNACSVCTRAKPFHKITATRINSPSKASQVKHEKLQYSSLASIPKRYAPIRNITLPYPFHISKAKPYCDHRGKLIIDPYFHEDLQVCIPSTAFLFSTQYLFHLFLPLPIDERPICRFQIGSDTKVSKIQCSNTDQ